MSFGGNVFKFENFKLGNMWDKIKKQPERLLIGGENPLSAKVAEAVTGKKYEPLVDEWGGATKDDYQKAEAKGINTKSGKKMHDLARVIAAVYAANWAKGAMNGAEGASGAAEGSATGAESGGEASSAFSPKWNGQAGQIMSQMGANMGQQQPQAPLDQQDPNLDPSQYQAPQMAYSSKRLKTSVAGSHGALMASPDKVDENGIEILAIQELSKRMNAAKSDLQALIKEKNNGK